MKNTNQRVVTRSGLVATALLPLFLGVHSVAAVAVGIASYSDFLQGVRYSKFKQFESHINSKVLDKNAFAAMQKHILKHYRGVKIANSFLDQSGSSVDCVTLKSQPSLQIRKMRGHKLATPPKALTRADQRSAKRVESGRDIKPQLSRKMKDLYGNTMYCRKGTIPMRRLTLETLTRFRTLDDFFSKGPVDDLPRKSDSQKYSASEPVSGPEDEYTHYWAHARRTVDNHGPDSGSRPPTSGPSTTPGWFSLAQHWHTGGTGANKQTVEGGWQLAELKYDNTNPNLFIYSTNANYNESSGCYNLDCAAFVQINNDWVLGGELGPVSTAEGTQYIFRMQWQLHNGNWWLFLKGKGSAEPGVANYHAIGYYPEEWFNGKQLTQHAKKIDYAGETPSLVSEMGGKHAVEGWFDCAAAGCRIDLAQTDKWPNLTKVNNTPDCYTADLHNQADTTWATYLYFGGPKCPAL